MRDDIAQADIQLVESRESLDEDDDFNKRLAFTEEELQIARQAPDKAVTTKPPKLGYASTILIIVNRMFGTGAFRTATTVAQATHSLAWSLGFWAMGGIHAVSGAYVFAELGLTIPRLDVHDEGYQSVPINGGELNYLRYFAKQHELLATCVYGIPFVLVGCIAANTIIFAQSVLGGDGRPVDDSTMRGVAIAVAGFSCALHATWRRAGLLINNVFGIIKIAILFTLFALGLAFVGGCFGGSAATASHNLSPAESVVDDNSTSVYAYAQSWIGILFTFGGFHQASYVLAEVKDSRRRFKITSVTTVAFVSIMFFLVQLSYMFVVPKETQYNEDLEDTVAGPFFATLFGIITGKKVQSAFMAFTSFGNIIVHTFTAARVKQEIAKTGILPFSTIIARNYRLTPKFLRPKANTGSEDTPAAALLLHFVFTVVLILATIPAGEDSYRILVNIYSFIINAVFGFLVGLGLLVQRLKPNSNWSKISTSNPYVSTIAALIYTVGNLFPIIAIWIPPGAKDAFLASSKNWYAIGTVGVSLMAAGAIWWVSLQYIIPELFGLELKTDREYNFVKDNGFWVVWHDVVSIRWTSP